MGEPFYTSAKSAKAIADAQNSEPRLLVRIDEAIEAASKRGEYSITMDIPEIVPCKDKIISTLREAGYNVHGTRSVKSIRIAWA